MTCPGCNHERAVLVERVAIIAAGTRMERTVRWWECVGCWRR